MMKGIRDPRRAGGDAPILGAPAAPGKARQGYFFFGAPISGIVVDWYATNRTSPSAGA